MKMNGWGFWLFDDNVFIIGLKPNFVWLLIVSYLYLSIITNLSLLNQTRIHIIDSKTFLCINHYHIQKNIQITHQTSQHLLA